VHDAQLFTYAVKIKNKVYLLRISIHYSTMYATDAYFLLSINITTLGVITQFIQKAYNFNRRLFVPAFHFRKKVAQI